MEKNWGDAPSATLKFSTNHQQTGYSKTLYTLPMSKPL